MGSNAEEILRKIELSSNRRYLPIIGPVKGKILSGIVRRHDPKRILEVGTLVGYSTIQMGKELGPDSEIITIELDEPEAEKAKENIRLSGIEPNVVVLTGDALEIIPTLHGRFDMVFLDAAKHQYLSYLKLVEDKLGKGSIVVADNAGFSSHAMKEYLEYVRDPSRYRSRHFSVGWDGIEVSIKL